MKHVLFITPYPTQSAPSQRFRFEQYFEVLKDNDFVVKESAFMDKRTWRILYGKGKFASKTWGILKGYAKRWLQLFFIRRYDYVFIHRELKPIGLPILEWLTCKFAKKVIYDFDDAIWLENYSESNKTFSFLKRYSTVAKLCKWSDKISCGNAFLANYAKKYNKNVVVNPTTIDTKN